MDEHLIENNFYDFTGSDIHNLQRIKNFAAKPLYFNKKKIINLLQKNDIFNSK
jgi:protein-tyrosine phosphatase